MKITKFYKLVDTEGNVRFESIYKVDTELYLKKLLRRAREAGLVHNKSIVEISR